jgi:hypothetical protein
MLFLSPLVNIFTRKALSPSSSILIRTCCALSLFSASRLSSSGLLCRETKLFAWPSAHWPLKRLTMVIFPRMIGVVSRGVRSVFSRVVPYRLGNHRERAPLKGRGGAIKVLPLWCSRFVQSRKYGLRNCDFLRMPGQISLYFYEHGVVRQKGRQNKTERQFIDATYSSSRLTRCLSQFTKSSLLCLRDRLSIPVFWPGSGG